jgi:cytochrome c5
MTMNKLICITLCFLGLALSECKSTKPSTLASPARSSTEVKPAPEPKPAAPDPIALGQAVYQTKCYQCHALPNTSDYTKAQWSDIMIKMSRKANLSDAETSQVLAFVNTSAK